MSRDLIEAAKQARLKAHAPYSKFFVGAAVRPLRSQTHTSPSASARHGESARHTSPSTTESSGTPNQKIT